MHSPSRARLIICMAPAIGLRAITLESMSVKGLVFFWKLLLCHAIMSKWPLQSEMLDVRCNGTHDVRFRILEDLVVI